MKQKDRRRVFEDALVARFLQILANKDVVIMPLTFVLPLPHDIPSDLRIFVEHVAGGKVIEVNGYVFAHLEAVGSNMTICRKHIGKRVYTWWYAMYTGSFQHVSRGHVYNVETDFVSVLEKL